MPGDAPITLFFAGWGMDENPFLRFIPSDRGFVICYDYRFLELDERLLAPYSSIRVIAWSMGVWAASQVLTGKELPVSETIAVNGTPYPVDDRRGIPEAIFQGTLDNLNERALYKFRRRMCSAKSLDGFLTNPPARSLESLREELAAIGAGYAKDAVPEFQWNRVYIGGEDKVFPPANQMEAWKDKQTILMDEDHFAVGLWKELFR